MRLVLLSVLLAWPALAAPPTTGAEWLTAVDQRVGKFSNALIELTVKTQARSGTTTHRTFKLRQKRDRRLIEVSAPPRLAGVALLSTPDGLHLYLPAFKRTRRIDGQARSDSFAGTDLTLDHLTRRDFSSDYTAKVERSGAEVTLLLTPRRADQHRHTALRLVVRAADQLITTMVSLNASGQPIRTVTLGDYKRIDGQFFAHRFDVTHHASGRRTTAEVLTVDTSVGLSERLFSPARLGSR